MMLFRDHRKLMLGCLLIGLLLTACSSDTETESQTPPVLNLYVYAPGRAMPTRSGIMATTEENKVKSLNIWVYKSTGGQPIGFMQLSGNRLNNLNSSQSEVYSLELTEDLSPETPINVYVLANVNSANCGLGDFGASIYKSGLEAVFIDAGYYAGYYAPASSTVLDAYNTYGIPMSGVLRNQAVTEQNAALHIKEARLDLLRAVSKIKFVFSKSSETTDDVYIEKIELDANKLYEMEYLFLDDNNNPFHIGGNTLGVRTLLNDIGNIKSNQDPTKYAYANQNLEAYEDLISSGITKRELTADSVYIGESDQKLTGKIHYHVGLNGNSTYATFMLNNNTFPRNSSWIVYAYYGATLLEVSTVQVKNWTDGGSADQPINNW